MNVDQVMMPDLRVAAVHRVGPYGPEVGKAFSQLVSWAGKNNLFDCKALVLGVYWDCPELTPPEKCRMDACVTLSPEASPALEDGVTIQTLKGGLCATYLCSVYANDFHKPWNELKAWLKETKAVIDNRPCYEIYYGPPACSHILQKWVIDIVCPLKEKIVS